MTSAEQFRSAIAHPASREISIAGVPWPAYKLFALIIGIAIFAVVAATSVEAGSALLMGAAVTTLLWLAFGLQHTRR